MVGGRVVGVGRPKTGSFDFDFLFLRGAKGGGPEQKERALLKKVKKAMHAPGGSAETCNSDGIKPHSSRHPPTRLVCPCAGPEPPQVNSADKASPKGEFDFIEQKRSAFRVDGLTSLAPKNGIS